MHSRRSAFADHQQLDSAMEDSDDEGNLCAPGSFSPGVRHHLDLVRECERGVSRALRGQPPDPEAPKRALLRAPGSSSRTCDVGRAGDPTAADVLPRRHSLAPGLLVPDRPQVLRPAATAGLRPRAAAGLSSAAARLPGACLRGGNGPRSAAGLSTGSAADAEPRRPGAAQRAALEAGGGDYAPARRWPGRRDVGDEEGGNAAFAELPRSGRSAEARRHSRWHGAAVEEDLLSSTTGHG